MSHFKQLAFDSVTFHLLCYPYHSEEVGATMVKELRKLDLRILAIDHPAGDPVLPVPDADERQVTGQRDGQP